MGWNAPPLQSRKCGTVTCRGRWRGAFSASAAERPEQGEVRLSSGDAERDHTAHHPPHTLGRENSDWKGWPCPRAHGGPLGSPCASLGCTTPPGPSRRAFPPLTSASPNPTCLPFPRKQSHSVPFCKDLSRPHLPGASTNPQAEGALPSPAGMGWGPPHLEAEGSGVPQILGANPSSATHHL